MNRSKNTWYALLCVTWIAVPSGCANAEDAGAADKKPAAPEPAARAQVDAPVETTTAPTTAIATETKTKAEPSKTADAKPLRPGEDWPKFLGPRDDGTSSETGLLAKWPEKGPPVVWEKPVGTGYSAPSVRGNRLVIHHRVRNEEIVDCLTADTGKAIWTHTYESNFSDPYGYNNGPRCSPLLTEDRCYTYGAEGKLLCLNLETGKLIWTRDTATSWKIPDAFFGVGSTPILHGKLLIVMVGGKPNGGVVAFDAATGETVWQNVDKDTWKSPDELDDKLASYSSPIAAKIHGHDHVFAWMRDGLVSLNPADGQVRFSYFFRSNSFESVNAARPVIIGDEVMISAAYKTGAALLKIKADGKGYVEIWKSRNLQTHWSTTIHHEGYLYGFSGRHEPEAMFRCIDLKSGDIAWETDGVPTNLPDDPTDLEATSSRHYGRASAIMAEGKFIVLSERGLLALVEVNPKEFKEISRVKLPKIKYPSWAAPVLSRKRLYLRCEDHMMCLDLAAQADK